MSNRLLVRIFLDVGRGVQGSERRMGLVIQRRIQLQEKWMLDKSGGEEKKCELERVREKSNSGNEIGVCRHRYGFYTFATVVVCVHCPTRHYSYPSPHSPTLTRGRHSEMWCSCKVLAGETVANM